MTTTNKSRKFRGAKTHGHGSMKKWRGAGNRGGRGMAGSGKKGDCKVPVTWKTSKYFGKYGFKKKGAVLQRNCVNLDFVESHIDSFKSKGAVEDKEGKVVIDLQKLGYDKLCSKGNIKTKFDIKVRQASAKAREKLKNVGGEIIS